TALFLAVSPCLGYPRQRVIDSMFSSFLIAVEPSPPHRPRLVKLKPVNPKWGGGNPGGHGSRIPHPAPSRSSPVGAGRAWLVWIMVRLRRAMLLGGEGLGAVGVVSSAMH